MGTHVADTIEDIAQFAAAEASRARPRKRETRALIARWREVDGLLPQEARRDAVVSAIEWMEMSDLAFEAGAHPFFEAIARYALWYEGYSFGR